ncbi:MAG: methyltransferase domain-containing protein [Acidobacteriota bacterium]
MLRPRLGRSVRRWLRWPASWRRGAPPPAAVAAYYDRWTSRYEAAFGDTFQSSRTHDLDELFSHIADQVELAPGQRILDAGCGVGGPARWLARRRRVFVDAINVSPVQVEKARRNVQNAGLGNRVRVIEGDFHQLDRHVPTGAFDAVLFLESLVHARQPVMVLAAAARVLRPGGILYVKDLFRRRDPLRGQEARRVKRAVANTNRHFRLEVQPSDRIARWLVQAGFRVDYLRELPIATQHDLGNAFCAEHGIDIYQGEPVTYLDWLELKARKTC